MRYTWTYEVGTLSAEECKHFNKMNKGYKATGETLDESYEEENGRESGGTTYAVMRAESKTAQKVGTPYGMCRDCGDHYIIARWSRYDRIDKGTLKRTVDVEDE